MSNTTTARLVYSSMTGDAPTATYTEADVEIGTYVDEDPYCYLCGRCTDHFGEHEDLVAAGMAAYEANGNVVKTAAYDREKAHALSELAYTAYLAGPVVYEAFCKALESAR